MPRCVIDILDPCPASLGVSGPLPDEISAHLQFLESRQDGSVALTSFASRQRSVAGRPVVGARQDAGENAERPVGDLVVADEFVAEDGEPTVGSRCANDHSAPSSFLPLTCV